MCLLPNDVPHFVTFHFSDQKYPEKTKVIGAHSEGKCDNLERYNRHSNFIHINI